MACVWMCACLDVFGCVYMCGWVSCVDVCGHGCVWTCADIMWVYVGMPVVCTHGHSCGCVTHMFALVSGWFGVPLNAGSS